MDASIADVPATVVYWDDADRVSTIQPLKGKWRLVVSRYYNGNAEDPFEGRGERVILVGGKGTQYILESSRVTPERFSAGTGILTFQCADEQAGDELLHRVVVYSMKGKKMKEVRRCRNTRLIVERAVHRDKESVGPDGVLKLLKVEESLPVMGERVSAYVSPRMGLDDLFCEASLSLPLTSDKQGLIFPCLKF